MANITQLPDYKFVQIATPTQGDLTLSQSISASDTSLIVNFEPKNEDGTAITLDFFMQLTSTVSGKRYTETMLCTAVSGTTLTVVRGIARGGIDYIGAVSNAISHQSGTVIKANLPAPLFQAHDSALKGSIGTGGSHIKIGLGTDANSGIKAYNADANKPYIEYNAGTNAWIASNDGTSSFALGTAAGSITGGDGITVTAGDIDIDLTDTVIFKDARTGNEKRAVATAAADGKIDKTFMPTLVEDLINSGTTVAEIDQALDGISVNVTATNLDILTAGTGSNARALHVHEPFVQFIHAGSASANSTATISSGASSNIIALNLPDASTTSGIFETVIPVDAASITSIKISYTADNAGNLRLVFYTARFAKTSGAVEADSTDTAATYASAAADNSVRQITVPAGAYNGITVTPGNILALTITRDGADGADTYASTFSIIGVEFTFA